MSVPHRLFLPRQSAILICALSGAWSVASNAATCSCAGVPLLGSMEASSPDSKVWVFNSSYEYHDIDDLVSGSDDVPDETGRARETQSLIVEGSYGIAEKWSVSTLISTVEHTRSIGTDTTTGRGLGDAIVMLRYSPRKIGLTNRVGLSFGAGAQIPLGDDDQVDFVTLSEDMQPSTGAWGTVFWGHASRSFSQSAKAQIFSTLTYSRAFENDRDYHFGDAWTLAGGASYQTDTPWGFSAQLNYRNSQRDERDGGEIPNTGGEWLYLEPSVQYHITENLAARLAGRIPVWRDLNDTLQFTTSYAVTASMSYVFAQRQ